MKLMERVKATMGGKHSTTSSFLVIYLLIGCTAGYPFTPN